MRRGLVEKDLEILDEMDRIYLTFPSYGARRMSRELRRRGYDVGRQKARHLMRILGVEAIYPRKRLSIRNKELGCIPISCVTCRSIGPMSHGRQTSPTSA
jgi:putative transposase